MTQADASKPAPAAYDPAILQDLLPLYYKRLFPHKPFYRWLSYSLSENGIFTNREFSFTLQDDIYIRYLSFENQAELEKEICTRNPFKIDIGPVMSVRPKDHRTSPAIRPTQRELVFDIDMTDYDEVRTCCSGADVCARCWKFMTIACRVLDAALRDDFAFEHVLWVFSGRRGIHCWVCDQRARHLDGRERTAVAEYLQLVQTGGEGTVSTVRVGDKMHHSVRRAYRVCEPLFEEIVLGDQNLFGTAAGVKKLVHSIADEKVRGELEAHLAATCGHKLDADGGEKRYDSRAVWKAFEKFVLSMRGQGPQAQRFRNTVEEVQLALLYPRLDINVSKGLNHLLKAPFCVHPKTGKVCVPFNPSAAAKFDPLAVPTINVLLDEINAFEVKNTLADGNAEGEEEAAKSRIKDYKKTGMFKGVVLFEDFLRKLELSLKAKARVVQDTKLEF